MYVNISRNKLLINNKPFSKRKKPGKPADRCNHCGGLIREDGELKACIMCSRPAGHFCANCTYTHASEVDSKNKKSA